MPGHATAEYTDLHGLDAPEATRATLLWFFALGVAFDLTFNGQQAGIAIPLLALALCASLRSVARRSRETDVLLIGAIVVSIFPALRASQQLASIDLIAASALLGLVATQDLGPISRITAKALANRGLAVPRRALKAAHYIAAPLRRHGGGRLRVALRVAGIALPIVALFAGLLASGDRVFARFLSSILPRWDFGSILAHIAITLIGATLAAVLWRVAVGREDSAPEPVSGPRDHILSLPEWATVLSGINVLFSAFVIVQFEYLFGGHRRVDVTPGLTYAEYARSGFFQLATAAALTVLLILAAWDAGQRDHPSHERTFRALVTAMVALTAVVLISAVKRLALYEGTFGFTIKRFFSYVGIASIGAMLIVLLGAIWWSRRERLVFSFLAVGFAALLAINILNPDRFVAIHNVSRFDATGRIDVEYLGTLDADAVPAAVGVLDRLNLNDRRALRLALCEQLRGLGPEPSWRSINLGRASARSALEAARITSQTCEAAPFR